jgi:hypothetical protein
MIRQLSSRLGLALLGLLPLACARVHGEGSASGWQGEPLPPYELSADEIRIARDLAEQGIERPAHPASPHDRVVFTKIELLPDAQAETKKRTVLVTHYRYRDDQAILSMIDLNRRQVIQVEKVPHLPTPLAPEELARAEQLARADARLRRLFAAPASNLRVEGKALYGTPQQPWFGHRVVALLFRDGGSYLVRPEVWVDLTSETVRVNAVPGLAGAE